jgi:hypothetical protein
LCLTKRTSKLTGPERTELQRVSRDHRLFVRIMRLSRETSRTSTKSWMKNS